MVREGETYTVQCAGYASDGAAVARVDGMAVFVPGALRGETCRVTVDHVGHRAAWAHVDQVVVPSPQRQTPDCPYYAQCGGCALRHMTYAEELTFKRGKVDDALRRLGGLDLQVSQIHGAQQIDRYRNKAQFPIGPGPRVGYYRARSHAVTDVSDCLLTPDPCAQLRRGLLDYMTSHNVPPYDEKTGRGLLRHLYVRVNCRGEALACLMVNGPRLPNEDALAASLRGACPTLRGVLLGTNTRRDNVILPDSYRTLWGDDALTEELLGLTFRLSVPSFFQVNHAQTEVLYRLAADFAHLTGTERVLDLYCGVGSIGLTLAHGAGEVLGVEVVPDAVRDAEENARRNGIQNARFLHADAAQLAQRAAREGWRFDAAIVDPPRKGLAPQVTQALLSIAPTRLIYVSCDSATLARDLKTLTERYAVEDVQCVDLFPRTPHIETVCALVLRA